MQHLHPVHDLGGNFGCRILGVGHFATRFPIHEVFFEFFVRELGPVLDKCLTRFFVGEGGLGPVALDLGDTDFFVGGEHQVVQGVEHAQLDVHLLVLFGGIVVKGLGALADALGGPVGAVGQVIADAFAAGDAVEQPEEAALLVGGAALEVLIGENAGLIEFHAEGQDLGGGEGVQPVFEGLFTDSPGEVEVVDKGRHGVGQLGETFHHIGRNVIVHDQGAALLGTVEAADEAFDGRRLALGPGLVDLVRPEILAADAGVAPGETFRVPFLVDVLHHLRRTDTGQDRHDFGDGVFIAKVDVFADILHVVHELLATGQVDRFGAAHGDGLDLLVAHDGPTAATARAGAGLLDGGGKTAVFTGQADGRHLNIGILEFLADQVLGLDGTLALQMRGIADLHLVVVDPDVDQLGRLAADDHLVVSGVFQFRGPESAHHRVGQQTRLGRDEAHQGAVGAEGRCAAEQARAEDQQIFRVEGLDFGTDTVVMDFDTGAEAPQMGL
ncbi:hypothetical protein DESC_370006 [Desulfosarcina cetonica]|nr:hypothetical protein DESC_370006 [Desulfosarcina cetonica]